MTIFLLYSIRRPCARSEWSKHYPQIENSMRMEQKTEKNDMGHTR